MDPAPQVIVIQIKQGKEIGGGNHYCIICRAPQSYLRALRSPRGTSLATSIHFRFHHPMIPPSLVFSIGHHFNQCAFEKNNE
ncbi:hypothetical protein MJO28_017833 [Puccinia striiformis f. sp. tritici]|nr:hypothetical protein MJO28_017833 [Puccinia striiformis f. sp. tritici]